MAKFWPTKYMSLVQGGPVEQTVTGSTANNQYLGYTACTSRDTYVSAPLVQGDSAIFLQPQWRGVSSFAVATAFHVSCVQAGSGFYISTINSIGFAASAASVSVWWEIKLR
jgi:hypothetical protein